MRTRFFSGSVGLSVIFLGLAGCGKGAKSDTDAAAGPATSASTGDTRMVAPKSDTASAGGDAERDQIVNRSCEIQSANECIAKERATSAYFASQSQKIASAPFDFAVERVWLKGSCAKGDKPEKRDDTDGLKLIAEGKATYKGTELLAGASLDGVLYVDNGGERFITLRAEERAYSYWGGTKEVSKFTRRVRGSDPWTSGQTRDFHWESKPLSEAFCEVVPKQVAAILEVDSYSVKSGQQKHQVKVVPVNWDEVIGMSARENVTIRRPKGEKYVDEPGQSLFGRLDKMLVVGASGKAEWLSHASVSHTAFLKKGPAASLPVKIDSPAWTVTVNAISTTKEFGGYSPAGEDQFLAVVDVDIEMKTSGADGKPLKATKIKSVGFKLETAPGTWRDIVGKATGQLDGSSEIAPGSKTSGKIVFPRQQFERPFRLEIKTPDKTTSVAEVFSYELKPASWK